MAGAADADADDCLLAQLFKSLFRWRIAGHEKNANATSVTMIDAIAVANAEAQADFK